MATLFFLDSDNFKEILMSVVHGAVEIPDPQVRTSIAIFFLQKACICQIYCTLNIEENICDVDRVLKKFNCYYRAG